jgi:spore germination protein KC
MLLKARRLKMKKAFNCLFIFLIIISLNSCISTKELKDLSIVEATGFDSGGAKSFSLTFQIFNPKSGGGGTDKKSGGGDTETIAYGSGNGIYDAIRDATLTVGRKLYFSNNYIYFVGEDVCRNNFNSLIDFFERPTEIRPNEKICVVKGTAKEVLSAKNNDQLIPAQTINEIIDNFGVSSKILDTSLEDIFEAESTGVTDIAIPAIKVVKDKQGNDILTMDGTAIFKKNVLVGYLDSDETRGVLWIMNKVTSGIIITKPSNGGSVSMEIIGAKTKVDIITKDSKPAIKIDVNFTTDVSEIQTPNNTILDDNYLYELKSLQEEAVKKEISSALTRVINEYDSDIFGFGFKIFQEKPEQWKTLKPNWAEEIKKIPIEITANSTIEHSGLITDKTTLK